MLNDKQKAFCHNYISNGYNGTKAYQDAYKCRYDTADARGSLLLKNEEVRDYLTILQHDAYMEKMLTSERVLEELAEIGFSHDQDVKTADRIRALEIILRQLNITNINQYSGADQIIFIDDLRPDI